MASLLVDIGNSYLKWGVDSEQGFVFGGSCKSAPELIDTLFAHQFKRLIPDDMFVACVGDKSVQQKLFEKAKSSWNIDAELMASPAKGCGITNAYADYEKLGSDRWAAMVAAFDKIKGPVCVVSSGTAVTLDAVNSKGEHLGGLIIPGYGLMQDCLQHGTRMDIRNNTSSTIQFELGQSTEGCIQQGVAVAISSMVDRVFKKLQTELPGIRLILTGGDAESLHNQLGCESSIDSHLVLKGLGIIHRSRVAAG